MDVRGRCGRLSPTFQIGPAFFSIDITSALRDSMRPMGVCALLHSKSSIGTYMGLLQEMRTVHATLVARWDRIESSRDVAEQRMKAARLLSDERLLHLYRRPRARWVARALVGPEAFQTKGLPDLHTSERKRTARMPACDGRDAPESMESTREALQRMRTLWSHVS